eukprot:CAMPEP_0168556086 /NCGR_PEP_ID=MMETSP0413-20121227/8689_1 /TAXON_ID=136452 /ORGANISM="Filamoeba nolandi, Strain NC-AS-23-1" /LENGTH=346 /DNA_ID=CAMNT_0008586997 /DNA_START=92 /DNA_END=1132 /DNA_ORIENTATION=+
MKDSHSENGYTNDHENSSKSAIIPSQRLQHTQNPLPSLQTLPNDFQKIFSTCYEIKRTCSDMAKLYGTDDPNVTKLYTQITLLENLLIGQDTHSVQIPSPSLNNSTNNIYAQTASPPAQSNHASSSFNNGPATATVVNITNYQYNQQLPPGVGVPLNSVPEAATQNQFAHASPSQAQVPVGIHSSPYGTYRQNNSFANNSATNAAVASIVAIGIPSITPPTPPNSYAVEKSEVNLDSDSDPDSQNSPVGSKKRRGYGQPGFPLIQDKGRGRRQRAKAAPPLVGEDQLYCRACGETQTCEWRRGPDGYKSLCNACGIHYAKIVKKEETAAQEYKPKSVGLSMLLNND